MIFSGLIGATCGGLIIDYLKLFKDVAVVSFSAALLCLVWFVEVSMVHTQSLTITHCMAVIIMAAFGGPCKNNFNAAAYDVPP